MLDSTSPYFPHFLWEFWLSHVYVDDSLQAYLSQISIVELVNIQTNNTFTYTMFMITSQMKHTR